MAQASRSCLRRLQREFAQVQQEGISPTVFIAPKSEDITTVDALVIGPPNTPYDGAMLHFRIKAPPEYPMKPPQVKFMSTDGGSLRIHPQLYADGTVCLSILGTWHGPMWTASLSLAAVLLSIQSLLNEEPLRCEPGLEDAPQEAVDRANVFVSHESMRALIITPLTQEKPSWGASEDVAHLTAAMHAHVSRRRSALLSRLEELRAKYDGQWLREPFVFAGPCGSRCCAFAEQAKRLVGLLPEEASSSSSSGAVAAPEDREEAGDVDTESERAHCRICHQTAEESSQPLIAPCRCAGSIRYAHSKCILNWLEYSGQLSSSNSYHCDICRAPFRVALGSGQPPGLAYLRRDLQRDVDLFNDSNFDAPGLVAVLFISFLQILGMTVGRVVTQSVSSFAEILVALLPGSLDSAGFFVLAVPTLLVESATYLLYLSLLAVKFSVFCEGPQWRPHDGVTLGSDRIGTLLGAIADSFFAMGMQLRGVVSVSAYFTLMANFGSIINVGCIHGFDPPEGNTWVRSFCCGTLCNMCEHKEPAKAFTLVPKLLDIFPMFHSLFPVESASFMGYVHFPLSLCSLCLNWMAIFGLLRRAFFDRWPVPVAVLPAEGKCCSAAQEELMAESSKGLRKCRVS